MKVGSALRFTLASFLAMAAVARAADDDSVKYIAPDGFA